MTQKAHVSEEKKEIVNRLVDLMIKYPVIAALNMENMPAPQLQKMRAELRDKVEMTMTKRRLMKIALEKVKELIAIAIEGKFLESRELLRTLLIDQGLAPDDLIRNIYREVMRHSSLTEAMKVKLSDTIGEVDYRLTQGSRAEIQLSTIQTHLSLFGEEMN